MTNLDLTKLREIAEAATPGPWGLWNPSSGPSHISIGGKIAFQSVETADSFAYDEVIPHWRDAYHIATFDPPTALALIDEIEQVRGQVNSVRGILERSPECNKYPDESVLHCGWKSDLNAIRETLNGGGSDE